MAEELFATIDSNKNGKLEVNEMREFSRGMLHRVKPDADFDEAAFQENYKSLDKNNDGTVSKAELLQSIIEKARQKGAMWAACTRLKCPKSWIKTPVAQKCENLKGPRSSTHLAKY